MGTLDGKVILVAGGATGIGAETCRTLAEKGASVMVGDIAIDKAEAVAAGIRDAGGSARAHAFDLGDDASVAALVKATSDAFGGIDGAHINGLSTKLVWEDDDVLAIDMDLFDRAFHTNMRGYVTCTRAVLPELLKRGGGSLVYTSSGAGLVGEKGRVAYGMCKAAINGLARHVALRWGKEKVRANSVVPGWILTEMTRETSKPFYDKALESLPIHRIGRPRDIAEMVAFLVSEGAEWVNGQSYSVDGGAHMR